MFKDTPNFSGFSVDNLVKAKEFYGDTLGVALDNDAMGLHLHLAGNKEVFVYEKKDHKPATFTVLNFIVENIDTTMDEMISKNIKFEHYDMGPDMKQDEKGVLRGLAANMGPDIAWFKDPAGNILSVIQEK